MAASVFQPTCDGESVVEQLDLWNVSPGTLSDVPSTCIKLNECNIAGSPNPRTSPCYRSYKVGLHADHFESALVNDTAWTISRHFNRSSQSTDSQDVNQLVPVWPAYNCLVNTPESGQQSPTIAGKAYALPIINAPAHEWSPLFTTLNQLSMVNRLVSKEDGKLIVTFDMDLYKRVLKLEYLDSQYKDKWVVCPGFFHKSLCALRCLGKTIEGSGSDEAWVEAEMYSTVTVDEDHMRSHAVQPLDWSIFVTATCCTNASRSQYWASFQNMCVEAGCSWSTLFTDGHTRVYQHRPATSWVWRQTCGTSHFWVGTDVHAPSQDFTPIPTCYKPRRLGSTSVISWKTLCFQTCLIMDRICQSMWHACISCRQQIPKPGCRQQIPKPGFSSYRKISQLTHRIKFHSHPGARQQESERSGCYQ